MKDTMKVKFDILIEAFAESMEKFNTLQDKITSPDYLAMPLEESISLDASFNEASAELHSQLCVFGKFMLENKDHVRFE